MPTITARAVEAAKPRKKEYKLTADTGLYLCVYPTGAKRWLIRIVLNGKQIQTTLPQPYGFNEGCLSLAQACAKNEQIQQLAKNGIDFRNLEKEEQEQKLQENQLNIIKDKTFNELFDTWISEGVSRKDNNAELRRMFQKDVLPFIAKKRISDITESDIRELLKIIVKKRGANRTAVRIYEDLSQLFKWAEERQPWRKLLIEGIPTKLIDIKKIISPEYDEPKGFRSRFLKEEEIQELLVILKKTTKDYKYAVYQERRKMKSPLQAKYQIAVWICLSTLCRVGELLMTEWKNVNLETGEWFIPKDVSKKNKGPNNDFLIFLSPFALEQFKQLYVLTGTERWCFPNRMRNATNHIGEKVLTKEINNRQTMFKNHTSSQRTYDNSLVLANGHNGDWTPHDLRRTGATMMQKLQLLPDIIDRCQNHIVVSKNKARRHYQLYEYANEKKEAWLKWGEYLDNLLK